MVFEGQSPHGLSVFGLVQVTTLPPVPQEQQPGSASGALQVQAAFGKVSAVVGGSLGLIKSNYVLIIVIAGLITGSILVYAGWYNRRRAQKKREKNKLNFFS